MHTREKGRQGEDSAVEYLLDRGYSVLSRNYQTRIGEIDLVAKDVDNTIVFLEVKTARSLTRGNPLYRITPAKQKKLIYMARKFIHQHKLQNRPCRFDVISIVNGAVDHIRNAFFAM